MLCDDIKVIDFLHDRDFFPDDNGAWGRIKKVLEAVPTCAQHTQPAKCLGCEYWQGIHGNICIRGSTDQYCVKVGTQQAGAWNVRRKIACPY
jgi:hypothetical protein